MMERCINSYFRIILINALIFLLASCSGEWAGCQNLSERKASPSGDLEMIIESRDCGATTSNVKKVYIVKKNQEPSFSNSSVLSVDKFEDLNIAWGSDEKITISYSKANIHEFKNHWLNLEDGNILQDVELTLVKK